MKRFELITERQRIVFKFPTNFREVSADFLTRVTSHVKVADNYTLVGLIYHEKLGNIIITRKQAKKSFTAGVVPVFIKSGKADNDFLNNAKVKDKLIIASTELALGNHVVCPNNSLSLDLFIKYLDQDTTLAQRYHNNYGVSQCYFVEFKLIPNCDIKGFYSKNPFLVNDEYITISFLNNSDSDSSDSSDSDSNSDSSSSSSSDSSCDSEVDA